MKKCPNCNYKYSFFEYLKFLFSLKPKCSNCNQSLKFSLKRRILASMFIGISIVFFKTLLMFFNEIGLGKIVFTIVYFNVIIYAAYFIDKLEIKND